MCCSTTRTTEKEAKHIPKYKKVVSGLLALLGAIGIHKSPLDGQNKEYYSYFCWSMIPIIIVFIQGIIILANNKLV